MKRRKWDAHTKAMIVIESVEGKPVAELCSEHQISQALSPQRRDQSLAQASNAFDDPPRSRQEGRLPQEHARCKPLVGELTCARKKATSCSHDAAAISAGGPA